MPFGQVRDIELYYEVVGSGPRLLFINGTGADLRRRQPYVDTLSDHFTVLRYDQRGLGQTDKPDRPYAMADYADDAAALMDLVGWDEAAVLGVSFGGSVAQGTGAAASAADYADGAGLREPRRALRLPAARPSWQGSRNARANDDGTGFAPRPSSGKRRTRKRARELIDQGMKRGGGNAADPNAAMGARRQLEAREEHDAREWIDQIKLPVGLFGGRYDGLGSEAGQIFMAGRIEGATMQLFEGAHGFLNEDPAAVPAVTAFLKQPD